MLIGAAYPGNVGNASPSARYHFAMGRFLATLALAVTTFMLAAPAHADPPPPGCQRTPIFGLNPKVQEICDQPIQPDGSWTRWRWFWHPEFVHSSCGGVYYQGGNCPPWLDHDTIPAEQGPVDKYIVTADTVPPGEPGYLGG